MLIPTRDETVDGGDELLRSLVAAVSQHTTAENTEPQLDLVQPRAVRRCVVEVKATPVRLIPLADVGPLSAVDVGVEIVQYEWTRGWR